MSPTSERFIDFGIDGFCESGRRLLADGNQARNEEEEEAVVDFLIFGAHIIQDAV